jgi:hypothetical protein
LADLTVFDVWVVDGCSKFQFGEFEGKLFGKVDVYDELEAFIGTAERSVDEEFPMEEIFFDGRYYSSL